MRLVYSSRININLLTVNVVELFDDARYSFPINNVVQSANGAVVDRYDDKEIDFTYIGTDLVFKGTAGWKVFVLASYDHKYIPQRPQPENLKIEAIVSTGVTVKDIDNFQMKPIEMVTKYVPAGLGECKSTLGQANVFVNKLQAQTCISCGYVYQNARKKEIAFIKKTRADKKIENDPFKPMEGSADKYQYDYFVAMNLCPRSYYNRDDYVQEQDVYA